ncbi:glycosyltransferase family 39 protein [Arachidicoccus terrestris]|uniref:glycosyltransferase family 39 protein n=1 Tax=Arachidicoccus terrestris TaxID=2875539 RepID=UPI001CC71200|nr:glycosyltransferase family 39 protein [Arachidicoccus terrestris]UAY54634.1 glycosyltransferase family 39 protein [Arachidicoccus terrestris]
MRKNASLSRFIYFLVILKILIPYLLQSHYYEPHRDELLYLAEGHHLAWGFMEVPPVLSIFAFLTNLFGGSIFWIKLWPSLFGAATFLVAGKIVQSLGGGKFAIFLLFLPFIFGVYLRLFFLFQPNTPEVFFVTLMFYSLIRFSQVKKNKWLYVFGISVGLGMMSKYSVGVFTLSAVIGLLLTPHRSIFLNRHFWIASLISLLIVFPNIIWQFTHGLPIVHHMELLNKYQLQYVKPSGFLMDQLLMNLPCLYIWIVGLAYVLFSREGKKYRFAGFAFLFVLIILLILHGKNYYTLGAFPMLFAFGAYAIEQLTLKRYRMSRYIMVAFSVIIGVILIPIMLPVWKPSKLATYYQRVDAGKAGVLRWEDLQNHPLPQDFADMLGWKEMAGKVSRAYNLLDTEEKSSTILFCDNYGQAGAVDYYRKQFHLPEPLSDNASFLNWIPDSLAFNLENVVLVTDDKGEMDHPFVLECKQAILVDSITNPYAKERGSLIILFKGINDNFKKMVKGKIEKDKSIFK